MHRKLAAGVLLGIAVAAHAAPFTPASDSEVVEKLPVSADPTLRTVESMRRQLASRPGDAALRLEIGQRYFDLAMAQGDPRFIGYASATIAPLEKTAPTDARYWLLRGLLQQYSHEFDDALQSLRRASELDPQAVAPVAWRAAIRMVQANYAEAAPECERLQAIAPPLLARGCTAYLLASTGHLREAYEGLAQSVAATPDIDPGLALWLHTR